MDVDPSVTLTDLRRDYRAACEASDEVMRGLGDPSTPVKHNGKVKDLRDR